MSQYQNSFNLLRGISDDNASFVTTEDDNDKVERNETLFSNSYQSQNGYNTFDDFRFHDQNVAHSEPITGHRQTDYEYASNARFAPVDHHQIDGLPQYDHGGIYQFQQRNLDYISANSNNGRGNAGVQDDSGSRRRSFPVENEEQQFNDLETHLQSKDARQSQKCVLFKEESPSDESVGTEDSGSDFNPDDEKPKRKKLSSKKMVTRNVDKRVVRTSDDESISDEQVAGPLSKKVKIKTSRSEFVPKIKARNYKLKTEEERQQDPNYKWKRDRNNDAVRKSRKKTKQMELQKADEMRKLQEENRDMKSQLRLLKSTPCMRCGQLPVKTETEYD